MRKIIITAAAVLLAATGAAIPLSPKASAAYADGESATDITSSSSYHDLCLLFNAGDFSTFSPFTQTYKEGRKHDYFDCVAMRPYGTDVYLYFYFDNRGDSGRLKWTQSSSYRAAIHAESESGYAATGYFDLSLVGNPYRSGDEYLLKYVARDVFDEITVGDRMGVCAFAFGKAKDDGIDDGWSFDFAEQINFTYDDANYDITAKLWGDASKMVTFTESSCVPMIVKDDVWRSGLSTAVPGYYVSGSWSACDEVFFYFFDADKDFDNLLSIDVSYNLVTYRQSAVYYETATVSNPNGAVTSEIHHDVPDSVDFQSMNEYTSEHIYKTVKQGEFDIRQNYHSLWDGFLGLNIGASYPFKFQNIYDVKRAAGDSDSPEVRNWIETYGRKEDGKLFQWAVVVDRQQRSWVGNYWDVSPWYYFFTNSKKYERDFQAHAIHGLTGIKMSVMQDGKQLEWNIFTQPIDSKPGKYIEDHSFTLSEILIAVRKRNSGLANFILCAYYGACALVIALVSFVVIKTGRKTPKPVKGKRSK